VAAAAAMCRYNVGLCVDMVRACLHFAFHARVDMAHACLNFALLARVDMVRACLNFAFLAREDMVRACLHFAFLARVTDKGPIKRRKLVRDSRLHGRLE
jgi:hypothetical protein